MGCDVPVVVAAVLGFIKRLSGLFATVGALKECLLQSSFGGGVEEGVAGSSTVGGWKLCCWCGCLWHLSVMLVLRTGSRQWVHLWVTGRK